MLHVSMTGQVTITGLLYRFGGNLRSLLQQLVVGMYLAICARDWMRVQLTWYTGPDQVQACAALPQANEIAFHGGIKCCFVA